MQRTFIMGLLASSILLSGCTSGFSEAPLATNFPTQEQHKLQAASHWQLISDDTAAQLMRALPQKSPLYVRQNAQQSAFEKAFTAQLIGTLTAAGYPVMKSADRMGTLVVDVSATPVVFSRNRPQYHADASVTMLAGGLWVLRNIYENTSPGAAMMAGAIVIDANKWLKSKFASGATPQTELIVTASVSSSDRYYAQTTSSYYTSHSDQSLYAQVPPALPAWPAVILPLKGSN